MTKKQCPRPNPHNKSLLSGMNMKPVMFPRSSAMLAKLPLDKRCHSGKWCQEKTRPPFPSLLLAVSLWGKRSNFANMAMKTALETSCYTEICAFFSNSSNFFKHFYVSHYLFNYFTLHFVHSAYSFCSTYTQNTPFSQARSEKLLLSRLFPCKAFHLLFYPHGQRYNQHHLFFFSLVCIFDLTHA